MGSEILETLRTLGVTVEVIGPDRLRLKPASKIPSELLLRIREAKPEILAALSRRPATCSPTCYEVEPGKWIHHPWDGCQTFTKPAPPSKRWTPGPCWHCRGGKTCRCIVCWQDGPGECMICHGSGLALRWTQ